MKKKKLFKGFVLAMAMVMLCSVTAFAGNVRWTTSDKISAQGSCGYRSATTTVSSSTYVYAEVIFTYNDCTDYQTQHERRSSSDNMGVNITAMVSEPSTCFTYQYTHGYHKAGIGEENKASHMSSTL